MYKRGDSMDFHDTVNLQHAIWYIREKLDAEGYSKDTVDFFIKTLLDGLRFKEELDGQEKSTYKTLEL